MYKILVYITYLAINKKSLFRVIQYKNMHVSYTLLHRQMQCTNDSHLSLKSHKYGTWKFSPLFPFSLVPFQLLVWPNH